MGIMMERWRDSNAADSAFVVRSLDVRALLVIPISALSCCPANSWADVAMREEGMLATGCENKIGAAVGMRWLNLALLHIEEENQGAGKWTMS